MLVTESLRAVVVSDPEQAAEYEAAWDELAVSTASPYSAPAWMLAWWRHVAPAQAQLRLVFSFDGSDLVGVAPFWSRRQPAPVRSYWLLGCGTSERVAPLAVPGSEPAVAGAVAEALASGDPRPDVVRFDGIEDDSPWPDLLRQHWPGRGRPAVVDLFGKPAPALSLAELTSFDAWMDSKSRNFRRQMRTRRKGLDEAGARFRVAESPEERRRGVQAMVGLHEQRWAGRGGSRVMRPGTPEMLLEVSGELDSSRLQVCLVEVEGRPIAAMICLAAGEQISAWLGGFDAEWERFSPSLLLYLWVVEWAIEAGLSRLDMGTGDQSYKYRMADGQDELRWCALVPSGVRRPLTSLSLGMERLRRTTAARVSPDAKRQLRRVLRSD